MRDALSISVNTTGPGLLKEAKHSGIYDLAIAAFSIHAQVMLTKPTCPCIHTVSGAVSGLLRASKNQNLRGKKKIRLVSKMLRI